jgi:ABC-type polysaccharide/polyol phosphate transport system ATPase subunit
MAIISVDNVSKVFRTRRGARALIGRGGLGDLLRRRRTALFTALDGVSFDVNPGESLGLIGANGSGKSTLLKIIAGVTVPTTGHVTVEGRVASLLELGAGFHPMLTGRENVYLNAGLLGMRHAQVDEVFDQIVAFSGIGDFIDNPVDTYSSGMYIRIAFAVASHVNPDIFLIDEVLAVGDEEFQRKCRTRIGELKEQGKTIVFVSHDLGIVNTLCDRVILLSKGKMISRGTPQRTIEYYLRQVGHESGIHTLRDAGVEIVCCHGRIALFQDQQELSAPGGFQMQFTLLNQYYNAGGAEWTLAERSETHCVARGKLLRLPATVVWKIALDAGRVRWDIELECDRAVDVDSIDINLPWQPAYTQWLYGDMEGAFPPIQPGDQTWSLIVPAETGVNFSALLSEAHDGPPPVSVAVIDPYPYLRMQMFNTDYVSGTRVVQVTARFPESERPLKPGRQQLMTLELDLRHGRDELRRTVQLRQEAQSVISGASVGRFHRGAIAVLHAGEPVTAFVHLHTECLMGNLWVFSHSLLWEEGQKHAEALVIRGESRRFPLRQIWTLHPAPHGFDVRVEFEALDLLEIQEYNVSVGIRGDYAHWDSGVDSGVFPPFPPEVVEWQHVNRDYAPSNGICAHGPRLPSIGLFNTAHELPTRMTALTSGLSDYCRILQALRVPEHRQFFTFEPGRHVAFTGTLRIGEQETEIPAHAQSGAGTHDAAHVESS